MHFSYFAPIMFFSFKNPPNTHVKKERKLLKGYTLLQGKKNCVLLCEMQVASFSTLVDSEIKGKSE